MSPTKSLSKPKVSKKKNGVTSMRKSSKEQIGVLYPLPESEVTPRLRKLAEEARKNYLLNKGKDLLNI